MYNFALIQQNKFKQTNIYLGNEAKTVIRAKLFWEVEYIFINLLNLHFTAQPLQATLWSPAIVRKGVCIF